MMNLNNTKIKKLMFKRLILLIGFVAIFFSGCDLSTVPYQGKTQEQSLNSIKGLKAATRGNYAVMVGEDGYYYYARSLFYFNEFPSDNVMWSGTSTDPAYYIYSYQTFPNMGNVDRFWDWAYKIIVGTNRVIKAIGDKSSKELKQIKGENLFLRAMVHYQLVKLFGRPYTQNPEKNLGVPIVTATDISKRPSRATVAEVCDFVIKNLKKAAKLMTVSKSSSYASKTVAWALLSRVYLNMEKNELAIKYANKVINSGRYKLVGTQTYKEYFTIPNEKNPETIFAIKHTPQNDHGNGNIGSLYYSSDEGVGWGEVYASKDYRTLLNSHPQDVRHSFIEPEYKRDENGNIIKNKHGDPVVEERNGYPIYYVTKFSNQSGIVTLSSPVILRLAEMYLNRAEANAKLGNYKKAIADVNKIRRRAGLSGDALYNVSEIKANNSLSVLDVVLQERRLEFAFEGLRKYDLLRNGRPIKRNYPGSHLDAGENTDIIKPTSPCVVLYIPESEIELNKNLKQNPIGNCPT